MNPLFVIRARTYKLTNYSKYIYVCVGVSLPWIVHVDVDVLFSFVVDRMLSWWLYIVIIV